LKLKCRPEDFRVEEISALEATGGGPYGLYLLEKRGLTTFEAIGSLARHLGRPPSAISAGGLKDKHAVTVQHVTVKGKPAGRLKLRGLRLTPVGRCDRPMTGSLLGGNRFDIVLREVAPKQVELLRARSAHAAGGLPNYFDEQRFGSLRDGEFIARKLIDGDHQAALRMHLAAPSRLDQPKERKRRKRMEELWGEWDRAFRELPRGNERSVVSFLRDHPASFARAFELIEGRLAQLYLFAYQSFLWNETLTRYLCRSVPAARLFEVSYAPGKLVFCEGPQEELLEGLSGVKLALPHPKAEYPEGLKESLSEVLRAEGIALGDLRVRGMRRLRFRAGERPALLRPAELQMAPDRADDLYPGKRKVRLRFSLPPGSYATLVVKFLARDLLPGSRRSRRGAKGPRR
jgi:tRNA pseudouridine13 synthase